jgi:regulator of sirC expression with transglutaminase-like and TPR domain
MELARRIGLSVAGVGLPGHFVVSVAIRDGPDSELASDSAQLLDVFDGGVALSRAEAEQLSGAPLSDADFRPATGAEILGRMLRNLLALADREQDLDGVRRYIEALLAIDPRDVSSRLLRATLSYRAQEYARAAADLDWLLENQPADPDLDLRRLQQLREAIRQRGF